MAGKEQTSVVEAEEKKKIDLKIEIENFGPISGGEITLKPLTVFVGSNNSGKSYAAMLIHSIFESYPTDDREQAIGPHMDSSVPPEEVSELRRQFGVLWRGEEISISGQPIEASVRPILEETYQERLGDEILRSFACQLEELIKIGEDSFTLKIDHSSYGIHLTCQGNKLTITKHPDLNVRVGIRLSEHIGSTTTPARAVKEDGTFVSKMAIGRFEDEETTFGHFLHLVGVGSIMCAVAVLKYVAMQCHYLPAARSGILQGHKALVANIIRRSPYAGIKSLEIPKLSGVISDFLSVVIDLPEKKGLFYQLARGFEKELIRGEIVISSPGEHLYPEIRYRSQNTEIPLHRSSSTVSELAPLFLYLKYKVSPGSILIIEEPEAHLHPGNQRILARLLVRLVREGVNVVITTHSEYLLEQLSNFIMLSKIKPEKRAAKYEYSKEDYVKPDEFAAYVFNYDAESGGHRIEEVEVTEEDGISDEEFARIYDSLYEEMIQLRMDLAGEE